MRCFIAVDIDENIRAGLRDLQKDLARRVDIRKSDVKWVRPELMHLTLKFLGEIKGQEVVDVCKAVQTVCARHEAFDFAVREVGCFGGCSARVVWVGAGLTCNALSGLQEDIEEQLAQAGWPKENRKFSGHLTLCRVRNPKAGYRLAQAVEQYEEVDLGTVRCATVHVYQSTLTPEGPIYDALGHYSLS